jgi:UDP-N-acetylglucosamine diphosphorylase/glucosamine-1-phosphate N-acetyltransferase
MPCLSFVHQTTDEGGMLCHRPFTLIVSMNPILFDDPIIRIQLLPFTYTRPIASIRVGILTMAEKWEKWLGEKTSFQTAGYLGKKFPKTQAKDHFLINAAVCPDKQLVQAIRQLPANHFLVQGNVLIAANQPAAQMSTDNTLTYTDPIVLIDRPWKIFVENGAQLRRDFELITAGRVSAGISDKHTVVYGEQNVFVEQGVTVRAAVINAERGPVYLGKNSIIHEGANIRGPFALCEYSEVNMGAKIRGDSTIGPHSKAGGEVSNSVIFGYSNKAHDGFLGCSVIGEWCNLGAGTNTSNLKNTFDEVKLWSHADNSFIGTGLQFCGLMMGDHSKCSINTMFNTGTVIDVSSNVFGVGFPQHYIPSFSWGGANGITTYKLEKALETAKSAMKRRDIVLDETEKNILEHIYGMTALHRVWEH